jgi:hypothetical protein
MSVCVLQLNGSYEFAPDGAFPILTLLRMSSGYLEVTQRTFIVVTQMSRLTGYGITPAEKRSRQIFTAGRVQAKRLRTRMRALPKLDLGLGDYQG